MKCSKEMAKKVEKFVKLQNEVNVIYEEIKNYFKNELDADGFCEPFIADKPKGKLQNDDEYCNQRTVGEDWYQGEYYHKIEGSRKYVGYSFDI